MSAGGGGTGVAPAGGFARKRRLRWLVFGLAAGAFWRSFFHRVAPAAIAGELQQAFGIGGAMNRVAGGVRRYRGGGRAVHMRDALP